MRASSSMTVTPLALSSAPGESGTESKWAPTIMRSSEAASKPDRFRDGSVLESIGFKGEAVKAI